MKKSGLNTKNMSNRRFLKTEEAILKSFLSASENYTTSNIAKNAHIARSTLYRHHKSVHHIIKDYENYLYSQYRRSARHLMVKKKFNPSNAFRHMLIFIIVNKKYFSIVLEKENFCLAEKMVLYFGPKIISAYRLPKNSQKILKVYAKSVAGVIENWAETNFNIEKLDVALQEILYLSSAIHASVPHLNH